MTVIKVRDYFLFPSKGEEGEEFNEIIREHLQTNDRVVLDVGNVLSYGACFMEAAFSGIDLNRVEIIGNKYERFFTSYYKHLLEKHSESSRQKENK